MKKVLNLIRKNIFGIIIGLVLGSVSVYAGTKFYASDVSVKAPTGSSLGSNATLQDSLDELYSISDKYDELNKKISSLESKLTDVKDVKSSLKIKPMSGNEKITASINYAYMRGNELILSVLFMNLSGSNIETAKGIYFTIESSDGSVFSGTGIGLTAVSYGSFNTYTIPHEFHVDKNGITMMTNSIWGDGNGTGAMFHLMKIN